MIDNIEESELRGETEEIIELLGRLEEAESYRIKNFGLEAYIPNAPQYKVHRSQAKIRLFCAGNRIGKSTCGATELAFHVTGRYPEWFPQGQRYKGPIKAVISATDFPIVRKVIQPKLEAFLPRGEYKMKRTAQGYLSHLEVKHVNGGVSTVDILTSEMKDMSYESADWDFAWCDEPQNQYKWTALQRGLVDRGGRTLVTFTPLTEPWMKEDLIDKADGVRIDVITGTMHDNTQDIKGNQILNPDIVKDFEDSIPEDMRNTRIYGNFYHMRGVVYKEFGEAHIDPDFVYDKKRRLPVVCVLDPHDRNPHHLVWYFIDETDDVWFDSELVVHCELPDLARKILIIEKERGYRMKQRLIDPNFGRKPAASGSNVSVMQELQRHGASFYEANDDVELGHMIVREYLHFNNKKPITAINKPKAFFSKDRVPVTIRSMRNLQFDEWKGNTKNERDPKEAPKQKDTHGADCVRYGLVGRPKYTRPNKASGSEDGPFY